MKKLIIGLFIGIIAFNCEEQSINSLDLKNEDLSELAFLREIIGDKRIVCLGEDCLLYTSPSPRDRTRSRMPSSA